MLFVGEGVKGKRIKVLHEHDNSDTKGESCNSCDLRCYQCDENKYRHGEQEKEWGQS